MVYFLFLTTLTPKPIATNMLVEKHEIYEMIPQRAPMVMVDGLIESHDQLSVSTLQLHPDNIFCKDGFFHEAGLIENMAQTAALHSGYLAKQHQKQARIGYIGALKRIKMHQLPSDQALLQTSIQIQHELLDAMVVKASVYVGESLIAEGEMNIFLADQAQKRTT